MTTDVLGLTRRGILRAAVVGSATLALPAANLLIPTDPDDEGPFYKSDAPFRETIFTDAAGAVRLEMTGRVVATTGEAIQGAVVDVWNADPAGVYDLKGFHLRGRVKTDSKGRYRFVTLLPKGYGNRASHLHFIIDAQDHSRLTTQLYFKGDPRNLKDSFVRPTRVISVPDHGDTRNGEFTFVLTGR
jgi:protocatechuate 3,4-dioxygenase beta subunit